MAGCQDRATAQTRGPSEEPIAAKAMLETAPWRRVVWRTGTKGPLAAEFAALRVRVADGPPQRDRTPLPGEEVWLIGERRTTGERKYYLSNLPPNTPLRALAARIKARWVCEQGHQQTRAPADEGGVGARSLRRAQLAWPASPCGPGDDRLGVSPAPSARQRAGVGKKWPMTTTDRRLNRRCPPFGRPFSRKSSLPLRPDVPAVGAGSFRTGLSRTAKVVLEGTAGNKVFIHLLRRFMATRCSSRLGRRHADPNGGDGNRPPRPARRSRCRRV